MKTRMYVVTVLCVVFCHAAGGSVASGCAYSRTGTEDNGKFAVVMIGPWVTIPGTKLPIMRCNR
jgi:hypothetical protein